MSDIALALVSFVVRVAFKFWASVVFRRDARVAASSRSAGRRRSGKQAPARNPASQSRHRDVQVKK